MRLQSVSVLIAALALGCGDPFTVADALGVWQLRRLNATPLTGNTPQGVTVRDAGGDDSTVTVLRALTVTFQAGSGCSWTLDDGISGPVTQTDCTYDVASDGTVTLDLVDLFGSDRTATGTARQGVLTLADEDTNAYELHKI